MDPIETRLDAIEQNVDHVKRSVDRIYKMFLWTLIVTMAMIVIPLIGMAVILPRVLGAYMSMFSQL